ADRPLAVVECAPVASLGVRGGQAQPRARLVPSPRGTKEPDPLSIEAQPNVRVSTERTTARQPSRYGDQTDRGVKRSERSQTEHFDLLSRRGRVRKGQDGSHPLRRASRVAASELSHDHWRNSRSAGITASGASSMSQCPEPAITLPWTSGATNLTWSIKKVEPDFSPARTKTGI